MFTQIRLSRYKFTLLPQNEMNLRHYLGSTIRGGFGSSFKKIVCCSHEKVCDYCLLKDRCIYSYIFETSPQEGSEKLSNIKNIPRPYIIEPPTFDSAALYSPERPLRFYLTLIGRAIEYFPYFIVAFQELGRFGLGKGKYKFTVDRVDIQNTPGEKLEQIYFPTGKVLNTRYVYSLEDAKNQLEGKDYNLLKIKFSSPVRLQANKQLINKPEFRAFFGSLIRRLSSLSYFHCNSELDIDYKDITSKAEDIKIFENRTSWRDWERYSSRQKSSMKMGGLLGEVTYEGNLSPFLPYLLFGQWIHTGKNPTFGLGKYEILNL